MITYEPTIDYQQGKVILLFSTEWCPDCIMLKAYINQVVEENRNWNFIFVDSDEYPQLASEYQILGIPSFVALSDGEVVATLISKQAKPKQLINDWISSINA